MQFFEMSDNSLTSQEMVTWESDPAGLWVKVA